MRFKIATFLFIAFLATLNTFATAQYPDKIWFEGKLYDLHSNPMDAYFEKHPDKKPKSRIVSSALWRGYVATFEIAGGGVFLKDVEIKKQNPAKAHDYIFESVIDQVVPKGEKLKVDWFTGLLVLPEGKLINYVHMGYGSTFENYTLIEVDSGNYKRSRRFDYKQYASFRERQFDAFKKTPDYKALIEKIKKDGDYDEKSTESFLRSFVVNYTSKILVD